MNLPTKTRKGTLSKILIVSAIVFIIFLCTIVIMILMKRPVDLKISNVDIRTIHDGVYEGNADNGLVKAAVSVEVKDGAIQKISILKHEHLLGKRAEKMIHSIVEQQSLEVDAISGATHSSNTLRKAIENALRQGE